MGNKLLLTDKILALLDIYRRSKRYIFLIVRSESGSRNIRSDCYL